MFRVVAEASRQLRRDLTAIGLLAVQTLAAAARVRDGEDLLPAERKVVERAASIFRGFAQRIRFVERGGTGAVIPHALLSTGVTGHLVVGQEKPEDPEALASYFDDLAAKLDNLKSADPSQAIAAELYEIFLTIAAGARAAAGSSGHITSRPTTPRF